ncbi:hypothetical protein [Acidovorax soli]|uniref:hypothetical protein n=1 Tax=Acidovorax TaxID=12916 RepID=UPI0026F2ED50|nr:hypothetical protein [Acidovorax soli]MCM2347538.1 hypothetical protein [Acidovorax soli]
MSLSDLSFLHQAQAPYDQGQAAPLPSPPLHTAQRCSPLQQGNAQRHASEKRRVAGHGAT